MLRNKLLLQQKHVTESIKTMMTPGTPLANFLNPPMSVLREFNFPLPTGVATLKLPFPLTEEDFENLITTLNTFKDGLVKKPEPFLLDCAEGWEVKAKALAGMGAEFNLINFDYSFEIEKVKAVAVENNLDVRLDLNKHMALFRKRSDKAKHN